MKTLFAFPLILFIFFSCQKKESIEISKQKNAPVKKDTLELLFANSLSDGRFHGQLSRVSFSDSIFFISDPLGESELYLKGKLILKKNIINYDEFNSIRKKFQLKEVNVLKFTRPSLNYQFKENSACTKLKPFNSKVIFHSVMKSKSGTVFQYIGYEDEIPLLKICNSNSSYIFNIKNEEFVLLTYDKDIPTYSKISGEVHAHIKLMDITGDGKEELLIFYDMNNSPDITFNVYQINYIE